MEVLKKTKIVCTMGPAIDNPELINELAFAGMNIVRFNFSHDVHENHKRRWEMVRDVAKKNGHNIGILMDTKGPEIRCGEMEDGQVSFATGDLVNIVREKVVGNKEQFHVDSHELFDDIEVGNYILIDDGKMRFDVLENDGQGTLSCRVANFGVVKTHKGCNVPNVKLSMPYLSERDNQDIRFACQNKVDFMALSFVRRKEDVLTIRKIFEEEGWSPQVISKIESQEGFDNLEEILEVSDGIMVARGDLGVEVSTALVPLYQKQMIKLANKIGKPVITATHMLESMVSSPTPTRAEASDVLNSILDGTDAIMLSGESAVGSYPLEAVQTMNRIALAVEEIIPYRENLNKSIETSKRTVQDSIGIAVSEAALNIDDVEAIVAFTTSGNTAKRISKYRPNVPILAVTFSHEVVNSLQAHWGVVPKYSPIQNDMYNDDELASQVAKEHGIEPGKLVIITAGYPTGSGTTNMMKIVEVK